MRTTPSQEQFLRVSPQRQLFLVGFARSGTSLLYNFLNLHPKIKLLYEADLLSQSLVTVALRLGFCWWERLDFFNSVCRRHRLAPQASWKTITSVTEAATTLYRQYGGSNSQYVGEKSPTYYNCIPELARKFPAARIIVIWRDPRNVISSIKAAGRKHYFFSNRSFPLRAILGMEQMQSDVLALRARGVPVFDLCYENLVENPELWLKSICEFLEIPFDPRMLELKLADCSMFPPGEHHAKVKSGLLSPAEPAKEDSTGPMEQKIRRYLFRWRTLFRDKLNTRRYWPETGGTTPNSLEVFTDQFSYRSRRFQSEQLIPFIYGFFPKSFLRLYRGWRGKNAAPSSSSMIGVPRPLTTRPLKISVITPSYKQLPWLKLCVASVADQKDVVVEHIIQDAQTGPQLEEWVRTQTKSHLYVECDTGMYDAINRGIARATGDIVCFLNSDEQYLEGTLSKVARFFETHPEIDLLFGDALLANNKGDLLSYQRTVADKLHYIQASHLNALSCATFVRRSVVDRGYTLNSRWRAIAHAVWMADLLQAGIPSAVIHEPLSVFTVIDKSLGRTSLAYTESKMWHDEICSERLWMRAYFALLPGLTKFLNEAYWSQSASAYIYTLSSPEKRVLRSNRSDDLSRRLTDHGNLFTNL